MLRKPDRPSRYDVVSGTSDFLTIRDIGPWDQYMTVTNNAEAVVDELFENGLLHEGQRLLYYDTECHLDEIVIENKRFQGFKPYRKEQPGFNTNRQTTELK